MTLDEARKLMTPEAWDKLHKLISKPSEIDVTKKVGNDIIMTALCQAVMESVIHNDSITPKIMKLLNSDTNTISDIKLKEILESIHKHQPDIVCRVYLKNNKNEHLVRWALYDDTSYTPIFEYVVNNLGITPQLVRTKLSDTLKTTIVNNMSQLVSKYLSMNEKGELDNFRVSIMSITRLVNMMDHIMYAKFEAGYNEGITTIEF